MESQDLTLVVHGSISIYLLRKIIAQKIQMLNSCKLSGTCYIGYKKRTLLDSNFLFEVLHEVPGQQLKKPSS